MPKSILIADDDKGLVVMLQKAFESRGYRIWTAYDGEEAILSAKRHKPDLVILDVQMPRMDGDQAAMILKAEESTRSIPILFYTGLRTDADIDEARDENILAKPLNLDRLMDKVRALLGE